MIIAAFLFQELLSFAIANHDATMCGTESRNFSDATKALTITVAKDLYEAKQCLWTITAIPGKKVKLSVTKFKFEYTSGCKNQRLQIFDGTKDSDPKLGEMCPHGETKTFISTGYQMFVKLVGNQFTTKDEFSAQYQEMIGINNTQHDKAICGEEAINLGLSKYLWIIPLAGAKAVNKQCRWRLYADKGKKVQITINEMTFPSIPSCKTNRLQFFDGISETGQEIATICNNAMGRTLTSSGSEMFVKFVAFNIRDGEGFKATYSQTGGAQTFYSCKGWIMVLLLALWYKF